MQVNSIRGYFNYLLFVSYLLLISSLCSGNDIPKFGKISDEEKSLITFQKDPEADAVTLFDVDDRVIDSKNRQFYMKRTRHTRIKILTEEGKERANFEIRYLEKDEIEKFQAHTVLPNGKKLKFKKDDAQIEKFDGWRKMVFAFPGVEIGSIIELKYEHNTPYLYQPMPWYFQGEDYTVLSQLSLIIEPGFQYSAFFNNTAGVEPIVEDVRRPGKRHTQTKNVWRMTDLPAIRKEPYMSTINDYLAVMHFQLASYKDDYQFVEYIDKWDDLVKEQLGEYKDLLAKNGSVTGKATELIADLTSDRKKWATLYEFVRDEIESTERGGKYPQMAPKKVLITGSATGSEKNMLLVNMLQSVGYDAAPVLISTLSHGRLIQEHPRLRQFNYMLASVTKGKRTYLMDTNHNHYPFDVLPTDNLSGQGLVIADGPARFVTIQTPKRINMAHCTTNGKLDESGTLHATSTIRYEGYRSVYQRIALDSDGDEKFFEDLLAQRFDGAQIDSFEVLTADQPHLPLRLKVHYQVPDFAQVVNDMMYLSSPALNIQESNPFQSPTRHFPVEFRINRANTDVVNIAIPDGMKVVELPKPFKNQHPGIRFGSDWKSAGNKVTVNREYLRQQTTFPKSKYKQLRKFFDSVVRADQGQIVLGPQSSE